MRHPIEPHQPIEPASQARAGDRVGPPDRHLVTAVARGEEQRPGLMVGCERGEHRGHVRGEVGPHPLAAAERRDEGLPRRLASRRATVDEHPRILAIPATLGGHHETLARDVHPLEDRGVLVAAEGHLFRGGVDELTREPRHEVAAIGEPLAQRRAAPRGAVGVVVGLGHVVHDAGRGQAFVGRRREHVGERVGFVHRTHHITSCPGIIRPFFHTSFSRPLRWSSRNRGGLRSFPAAPQ